jgi:hypothetical protein
MTAALGLLAAWFTAACIAGPIVGGAIRRRGGR